MNILIVDSDSSTRPQVRDLLTAQGHKITVVDTPTEAFASASECAYDLVLANVVMPEMDGFCFCRQWKSDSRLRSVPVVLYTDLLSGEENREAAISACADGFVAETESGPGTIAQNVANAVQAFTSSRLLPEQTKHATSTAIPEAPVGGTTTGLQLSYTYSAPLVARLVDRIRSLVLANHVLRTDLQGTIKSLESSRIAEAVFATVWDAILVLDPELRVVTANRAFYNLFKLAPETTINQPIFDVGNRQFDIPELRALLEKVRSKETTVLGLELHHDFEKTGRRVMLFNARGVAPETGMQPMIVVAIEDITERIAAQRKLEISEQRLRASLENAHEVAIQWYDENGRIKYWNPASEQLYGWKAHEVIGRTLDELILTSEQTQGFVSLLQEIKKTGKPSRPFLSEFRSRDGRTGWIRSTVFPIPSGEGQTWFVCMDLDVTDQVLVTEALRASEERFRTLADHSVAGIYVISEDRFLYVNRTLADIFGYTPEEMLAGVNPLELVALPDRPRVAQSVKQRLTGLMKTAHHSWRGIRKDGRVIVVDSYGTVIQWEGKPAVMGTMLDVTEQAMAHEEIARIAREWETTFEATNDAVWVVNADHCVTRANKTTLSLLGIEPAELVGRRCFELVHRSSEPHPDCILRRCVRSGRRETREMEIDNRWFEVICDPIRDASGRITGAVHIMTDITLRKKAEAEIRERENRYRALVEQSQDTIGIFQEGKIVFMNPAGVRALGYSDLSQIIGKNAEEVVHPDDMPAVRQRLKRLRAGETGVYPAEVRYRRANGEVFNVEVVVNPITFQGKPAMQFVARDITARKRAEEEREKLQLQLHQAMKLESIGRLAGGVAHDFNNMLQAILGYVTLALAEVPTQSPVHDYLLEIEKAANRAAALTRQLVTFARKQTIRPVILDLNIAIENTLAMLRRIIGENIDLEWVPATGLWFVKIDPTQVDQILANLAVNARDAISGTGKLTIETHNVTLDHAYAAAHPECKPGEYVMLAVTDTGCGMDKETMSHLFEPFFTTKEKGKGSGLGLATVFGIVKQNDGFINVYSEAGQGTTFKVYLPRAIGEPTPLEKRPQSPLPGGTETILLVEDEPQILDASKRALKDFGYTVLVASSPREALELAAEYNGPIHLLVTDVVMPDMDGKKLEQELLNMYPNIKTVFMSGYTENAIVHNGLLENGIVFLQKPFSVEELLRKVREALDKTT